MKFFILAACLIQSLACAEPTNAPAMLSSNELAVLKSREGADDGAKPCKYDALPRPSVLVTPGRLEQVRQAVLHGDGEQHGIYEWHTRVNADRWVHRDIVIPDVGGWGHSFFCTDGTMLELPADQHFDPNKPSRCPVCGKTYSGPKITAARHFFEHYWLSDAARDLALVYAIEQKPEYARKAAEILVKYADAYPHDLGAGGYQENTLNEANSIIPLAEAYDLICDQMTPAQRDHVERDFFWPVAESLTHAGFVGNWGSWHLSAIGVIGYATRHQRFIDFATAQFKKQISENLGNDGLWPESVGTYHFYALEAFISFAEAAANCGDDLYHWTAPGNKGLEAMFEAPLRYAYPNLRLAAVNDGWFDAWLPRDQYTLAYHRYHRPEFAWAIRKLKTEGKSGNPGEFIDRHNRYLLYDEDLPAKIPRPVFGSTSFPGFGIAILRQGSNLPEEREMMLTFHYGPFLGHGHYDKMGITLFANGHMVAPDYGTTGYGIALSGFLQSAPGHNTIVVDGKNQPRTASADLVVLEDRPDFKLATASTDEICPGTTWTRTVMLADSYAVIWDRIEGSKAHQYDWMFHAEGTNFSFGGAAETPFKANKKVFPYSFITQARSYALIGPALAQWNDGSLAAWVMPEPGQTAFSGQFPTPDTRTVPELILRQTCTNAEFLVVLRPGKIGQKAALNDVEFTQQSDGSMVATVKVADQRDKIRLGKTLEYTRGKGE